MERTSADAAADARTHASAREDGSILLAKWGLTIIDQGYTAVPDVLLSHMYKLKLTPTELVVLLQLLRFWWLPGRWPFPSKGTLARAIGSSEKNVQKVIARLVQRGFVKRLERRRAKDRSESNSYDLSPLIKKLEPLAEAAAELRVWEEIALERERENLMKRPS